MNFLGLGLNSQSENCGVQDDLRGRAVLHGDRIVVQHDTRPDLLN